MSSCLTYSDDGAPYLQLINLGGFQTKIDPMIKLTVSKVTLGRAVENTVSWPSLRISRNHCVFEEVDGKWTLTNLSPNGLLINGVRLAENQSQVLNELDKISFLLTKEPIFQFFMSKPLSELQKLQQELRLRKKQVEVLEIEHVMLDLDSVKYEVTRGDQDQLKQALADANAEKKKAVDQLMGALTSCFQCSLCSKLLVQATLLGCGHTYCESCITTYHNQPTKGSICPQCPRLKKEKLTVKHVVLCNFLTAVLNQLSTTPSLHKKC